MAGKTSIEWTEQTYNPIVGCSILSPGCTNCYAMKMAARIEAMGNQPRYAGTTHKVNGKAIWTGKVARAPEATLLAPLRRKIPTVYFVNSMSDLFHEDVPDEWIDRIFAVMALTPHHTYQVLTKRSARMQSYCSDPAVIRRIYGLVCDIALDNDLQIVLISDPAQEAIAPNGPRIHLDVWPLPNAWLGVSTERQKEADERIPDLLQTPAAVRFISAEPLLGPIDLIGTLARFQDDPIAKRQCAVPLGRQLIDWVIAGGESGGGARPMDLEWAFWLRDQCRDAGIAFFMKQISGPGGRAVKDIAKFPPDLQVREMPRAA